MQLSGALQEIVVMLEETIAQGHSGCRLVVYLKATRAAEAAHGREYFEV